MDDNECCNTCNEVRAAYRRKGWAFTLGTSIEQCRYGVIAMWIVDSILSSITFIVMMAIHLIWSVIVMRAAIFMASLRFVFLGLSTAIMSSPCILLS